MTALLSADRVDYHSTDITDAAELLNLKEHERPEGYASSVGKACVRMPVPLRDIVSADEARAWVALLAEAINDAEFSVEEQANRYDDGAPDEQGDETQRCSS